MDMSQKELMYLAENIKRAEKDTPFHRERLLSFSRVTLEKRLETPKEAYDIAKPLQKTTLRKVEPSSEDDSSKLHAFRLALVKYNEDVKSCANHEEDSFDEDEISLGTSESKSARSSSSRRRRFSLTLKKGKRRASFISKSKA